MRQSRPLLRILLPAILAVFFFQPPMFAEDTPIDLDLNRLNNMTGFAVVNEIINTPEEYDGQRIRLKGYYNCFRMEDVAHHQLVVVDMTACCFHDGSVGVEFSAEDEMVASLVQDQEFELIGIIHAVQKGARNICIIEAEKITLLNGSVADIAW